MLAKKKRVEVKRRIYNREYRYFIGRTRFSLIKFPSDVLQYSGAVSEAVTVMIIFNPARGISDASSIHWL